MAGRQNKRIRGRSKHLWENGKRTCAYCGRKIPRHQMSADHVKPLSRGGYDKFKNIVPACKTCNFEKADMTREEYLAFRARRVLDRLTEAK